jgi:CRP-like cAMP-binding protein
MPKFYKKISRTFGAGEMIFTENSPCDGMYIIEIGRVRVFKSLDTPTGIKELELVQLGPKSLFGEMALIDDQKRSASVQAMVDTRCMVITKEMFRDQIEKLPPWVTNLIQVLVVRLRETNEKLREKARSFHDDTGSIVYVDESEQSQARDAKLKLEEAIDSAQKTMQNLNDRLKEPSKPFSRNVS